MRGTMAIAAALVFLGLCLIGSESPGSMAVAQAASSSRPTTTSAPASAPAGTGTVSGKAVDEAGKAVQGAEAFVLAVGADRKTKTVAKAKTGRDGAFKIEAVPPGKDYRVWVSFQVPNGPMLMGEVRDQKVEAGRDTDVGAIRIAPARM